MAPTTPFTAFRIDNDDAGYRSGLAQLGVDDLNPGQVLIRAHWSSVNYKDALAGTGKGKILRRFPLVGGIDVAGLDLVQVGFRRVDFQGAQPLLLAG